MLGGRNKALILPLELTRDLTSGCEGALSSKSNALIGKPFSFKYFVTAGTNWL